MLQVAAKAVSQGFMTLPLKFWNLYYVIEAFNLGRKLVMSCLSYINCYKFWKDKSTVDLNTLTP